MNDQQAAEYMAGIESEIQAARWALPVLSQRAKATANGASA